ncbi:hypothetical protein TorRG33x02_274740 [Trema orientale]|uniref:Uncharacterized protein n=1 Tax=Trema orientale TaxID=63057 RepID=A0A2P5CS84_TREOI|nr:hypothetical protein TorRG33x02_274740 [Trema orientale]
MEIVYVMAIAVIVTHIITVRTHMKNLRQKGRPVMSGKIMLKNEINPTVLQHRLENMKIDLTGSVLSFGQIRSDSNRTGYMIMI